MSPSSWTTTDYIEHAVAMFLSRAELLVSQCEIYMARMKNSVDQTRASENEKILTPHVTAFRAATTDRAKLESSESLVDAVFSAILSGQIGDRTLPDDAMLLYKDPSGDKCEICALPQARSYVDNQKICTKCLLGLEW